MSTEMAIAFIGVCGVIIAAIIKVPWRAPNHSRRAEDKFVTDELCRAREQVCTQKIEGLEKKVDDGFSALGKSLDHLHAKIDNGGGR